MSMSATKDRIYAALNGLQTIYGVSEYADMCAIGVYTDDPTAPGVTAVVFQGQLYALVIPDSYTNLPPDTLSQTVNAVIINAYREWGADRRRLSREGFASVHAA